ncbi:hypothetical protein K474DRAFT_1558632, partial [Panus rudis PR-1116 ss-1]
PQWIQDAVAHLRGISDLQAWNAVIDGWVELERALEFPDSKPPNRLPTADRPEEITIWMSNCNLNKCPVVKAKPFSAKWKKWYSGVQPESRATSTWPFERSTPPDNLNWGKLLRGGPAGFFLFILSLSWW